jgi:spore germination cell wall hydrolase CwlJ-like protein
MISTALLCLALNVYHEARGESFTGQVAVAEVTVNRAEKTGEPVCKIVTAYKQFSWLNDDFTPIWKWEKGHKVVVGQKLDPKWMQKNAAKDLEAWQVAVKAARLALYGLVKDPTRGSTYYHATYVTPKWKKEKVQVARIGKHIFYVNRSPAKSTMLANRYTVNNGTI